MIVIDLPEPPNVANRRVHWAVKRDYKQRSWAAVREQTTASQRNRVPDKVRVSAHFRLHQTMDQDNLFARLKLPLDVLKGDFFVDDSPEHLELGEVTQRIDRKNRGLTITIEEL